MQVTLKSGSGCWQPMGIEVVTRHEVYVPAIGKLNVSGYVQVLSELIAYTSAFDVFIFTETILIFNFLAVWFEIRKVLTHGDAIAERKTPRHGEAHIAVIIGFCLSALFREGVLSSHHVGIDVGIQSCIIIVITLIIVGVFILLVISTSEEFPKFLRIKRVWYILRHSREVSEMPYTIVCSVTLYHTSFFRFSPRISRECGTEAEGIVFPPLQSDIHSKVAPRMILCSQIVWHTSAEIINEGNLLEASSILVRLDFHLKLVSNLHTYSSGLATSRSTFILYVFYLFAIAEVVRLKIRRKTIRNWYCRGEDMTDSINLVTEYLSVRNKETIQLGIGTDWCTYVIHVLKTTKRVSYLIASVL